MRFAAANEMLFVRIEIQRNCVHYIVISFRGYDDACLCVCVYRLLSMHIARKECCVCVMQHCRWVMASFAEALRILVPHTYEIRLTYPNARFKSIV